MNKITSSKLDAQKLARLIEGSTAKNAGKQQANIDAKATINALLNDSTKIVSPSYTVEIKGVKDYLATHAAKINY